MAEPAAPGALMETYRRWPVELVWGSGCRVRDSDGNTYLDLLGGIAVCSVGHCHPRVAAAIADQAFRLMHVSNLFRIPGQQRLAERLAALSGGMRSFFCNSGAEAIECALKLARRWAGEHRPGARNFVAAEGGFHGRTLGALAATGQPAKRAPFEPLVPGFSHVPYGDLDALDEALTADVCALLLEPVQGEAGVVVPPPGYLAGARRLCDERGVLLIVDEVQTGLGRTGRFFAYEHEDIRPDVVCLAKPLAGGLPLGACLARPEVAAVFRPGDHGSTFGGGPLACAAALAVLDVITDEGLVERAGAAGERLWRGLEQVVPVGARLRGMGLLLGVELPEPGARRVAERALERGVIVNDATERVVRLAPPLTITDAEIDEGLDVLEEVFDEV